MFGKSERLTELEVRVKSLERINEMNARMHAEEFRRVQKQSEPERRYEHRENWPDPVPLGIYDAFVNEVTLRKRISSRLPESFLISVQFHIPSIDRKIFWFWTSANYVSYHPVYYVMMLMKNQKATIPIKVRHSQHYSTGYVAEMADILWEKLYEAAGIEMPEVTD